MRKSVANMSGVVVANKTEGDKSKICRQYVIAPEENYKAGYGKGMGRKFLLANFLCKIRG